MVARNHIIASHTAPALSTLEILSFNKRQTMKSGIVLLLALAAVEGISLQPNVWKPLPVGSVTPKGWLLSQVPHACLTLSPL